MKKYLTIPMLVCMSLLLATGVFAMSYISIRGTEGNVHKILGDNEFTFTKVKFSAWSKSNQGQGSVNIIARDTDGKRIVMNLRLKQTEITLNTQYHMSVNSYAYGTYWKQGEGRKPIVINNLNYWYNKHANTLNLAGQGLHITNIQIN